uniref:Stigma-specific protein Stig1 n=1 Tax=Solanum tuberosum TaxID=4113 RepID=M0ZIX2_SOLTU
MFSIYRKGFIVNIKATEGVSTVAEASLVGTDVVAKEREVLVGTDMVAEAALVGTDMVAEVGTARGGLVEHSHTFH